MEHKKIAIVANSTWNIYNFRQELIRAFKIDSFRVIVIAPLDEYIHYLNESYFTKHIALQHLNAQGTNFISDMKLLRELYLIYKAEKPDIILHFTIKPNIYGSIAARWIGIPCISTLTGLGYSFTSPIKWSYLLKQLYKFALKSNQIVVFHNADDLKLFQDNKIIQAKNCTIIPGSGVDIERFKFQAYHNNNRFIFLFIGRLLVEKGLLEFIKAAGEVKSIVKNSEFWVVGEWNEKNPGAIVREDLLEWVETRKIKYLGAEKDVRKYLMQCNTLVLPSYREGIPKAILEAMAMEIPIITCDTPGCKETVQDNENGFLVPPKDSHALAEAMVKIFNLSEAERQKMGKLGRALVIEKFEVSIILKEYLRLVHQFLNLKVNKNSKLQKANVSSTHYES